MKKKLLAFAALIFAAGMTNAQSFIGLSSGPQCYSPGNNVLNAYVTNPVPNATNYTWTVIGTNCNGTYSTANNADTAFVTLSCAGTFTIGCSAFNGTAFVAATMTTIAIMNTPTLTISGPNAVCPGNTAILSVPGVTSCVWQPGNISSLTLAVTPSVSTCYTATGVYAGGCSTTAVKCISITPFPVVTASANNPGLCSGQGTSVTATGASSYTWQPGNMIGATQVVFPSSSTCYTVTGSNGSCSNTAVVCLSVSASPTLTINGTQTTCIGSQVNLSASGANTYTWSTGSNFASILVSPVASACYTAFGSSPNGCVGFAIYCVSVMPSPAITLNGPSVVCLGTSANLSASGGTSYMWSNSATTATVNVTPTASAVYTVLASNGNCTSAATIAVSVNPNCSDVWPGDANSDGVVNNTDVLELGLQATSTGAARTPGGNSYNAQYASNWTGTISTGKNKCHADCNGDGVVNQGDTLAIFNNFSLTHSFKPAGAASGDVNIQTASGTFEAGRWNTAQIIVGDATNVQSQVYGLALQVNFDQSIVVPDSAYVVYNSSFINGNNGNNIQFRKSYFNNGKIYLATVRTDQSNVNGYGTVAELHFKVKDQVNSGTQLNLGVSNVQRINNSGATTALTGGTSVLNLETNPTGIAAAKNDAAQITLYPNPAKNSVSINSNNKTLSQVSVSDLSGREIFKGNMEGSMQLDTRQYQNGVYIVTFKSDQGTSYRKLIIEK